MKKLFSISIILVLLFVAFFVEPVSATPTQLDTSGTKIGNMTSGYGLVGLFDGQVNNNYYQGVDGYAGVVFSTPHTISSVEIDSQINGYDASGSTTQITLSVYARTSGTPSSSTDGTLIGSLATFTDTNAYLTKTITSTDTTTQFSCVWIRIQTSVWAAATEIRFYGDDDGNTPTPTNTATETLTPTVTNTATPTATGTALPQIAQVDGSAVVQNSLDDVGEDDIYVLLTHDGQEIQRFRTPRFHLINDSTAMVFFRADVAHRGEITGYTGALSIGFRIWYRYSSTQAGLDTASLTLIFNGVQGCNIEERNPAHYGATNIFKAISLPAGYYEFTVTGSAATDASGWQHTDGLAKVLVEYGEGLNNLMIVIDPDRQLIEE